MDNFLLQTIAGELESKLIGLIGLRLGRVSQIGATDLVIDFHLRDDRRLAISTDPQRLALYLTARSPKQISAEHKSDTAFVSLLKKYLGGARLTAIEKLGYDRVVNLDFQAEGEDGQVRIRRLVVLLTGRGANVLLVEGERVIASLRERDESLTNYIEPAPPADKLDPFLCSAETLNQLMTANNGNLLDAAQKGLIGFTTVYARELAHRAQENGSAEALRGLLTQLSESKPTPTIYSSSSLEELRREVGRANVTMLLSPIELQHLSSQLKKQGYHSVNEAADAYFTLLDERRRFTALKGQIHSQLSARIKKRTSLIANLKREREGFSQAETHQRYGDLLLSNLHQISEVDGGFSVIDFFDEAQARIVIPSANKGTPREAAEHYFKLARKARHGLETINQRLPEAERELDQLERLSEKLAAAARFEELNVLIERVGLTSNKPNARASSSNKKVKEEKLPGVRRYRSSEGYEMLVGRTNRDNDNLTLRIAKSFDLWFHAADYPGSHVVLRNPQRKPVPPKSITEAAQLAAKFSQARENPKVAVNYCERKFVTKPKGFAPGQVRLSSFKTVIVQPKEAGERI